MEWVKLTLVKDRIPCMLNMMNAIGVVPGPKGEGSLVSFSAGEKATHVEETLEVIEQLLREL